MKLYTMLGWAVLCCGCGVRGPDSDIDSACLLESAETLLGDVVTYRCNVDAMRSKWIVGGRCDMEIRTEADRTEVVKVLTRALVEGRRSDRSVVECEQPALDGSKCISFYVSPRSDLGAFRVLVVW